MLTNHQCRFLATAIAVVVGSLGFGSVGLTQDDDRVFASGAPGLSARMVSQMQETVKKADTLAAEGIQLQGDGRSGEATEVFKQAFQAMPAVPATKDRRIAYFKRYQASSAAYAQSLMDQAQFKKAQAVLTEVYQTASQGNDIPPTLISADVSSRLKKLKAGDFNQALTPSHLQRVSAVSRLLIEANGAIDLGDFNLAEDQYNKVLAIDPYNKAARRGLETVEKYRLDYLAVARDQNRAKRLAEISAGWESPVPPTLSADSVSFQYSDAITGSNQAVIETKLRNMIIPRVEFQEARLSDVLQFLTRKSQELDLGEVDPAKRGINFIINGAPDASERLISIRLSNIPLGSALTYITQKARLKYRVDEFAVTLLPINSANDAPMQSRNYQVPPDFLSRGTAAGGAGAVDNDPFADPVDASGGVGTPVTRLTATEFLEQAGVSFEPGASANFNPRTSMLTVRNRPDQLELIDALVAASRESAQKMVRIDFRLISIAQRGAEELGFDWLLGQSNLGNSNRVFTSGGVNQSRSAGDFPIRDPSSGNPVGLFPVTGGLRSGNSVSALTIDDVIGLGSIGELATNEVQATPAVFGISGVFTDPQFQTVIRALNQQKSTDQLNMASVVVRPGERAIISQIREFIYPTEYDPPEIPANVGNGISPVTPATPTSFETRDLGRTLTVEPTVGPDNTTVSLSITTDMTDFAGFINYGSPVNTLIQGPQEFLTVEITPNRILMPVFDTIRENTNVTVWDSQTISIGGLITEGLTLTEDKVPVLGDIPLFGRAFRTEGNVKTKRGLVMFVSARILDPSGQPVNQEVGDNTLPAQ